MSEYTQVGGRGGVSQKKKKKTTQKQTRTDEGLDVQVTKLKVLQKKVLSSAWKKFDCGIFFFPSSKKEKNRSEAETYRDFPPQEAECSPLFLQMAF